MENKKTEPGTNAAAASKGMMFDIDTWYVANCYPSLMDGDDSDYYIYHQTEPSYGKVCGSRLTYLSAEEILDVICNGKRNDAEDLIIYGENKAAFHLGEGGCVHFKNLDLLNPLPKCVLSVIEAVYNRIPCSELPTDLQPEEIYGMKKIYPDFLSDYNLTDNWNPATDDTFPATYLKKHGAEIKQNLLKSGMKSLSSPIFADLPDSLFKDACRASCDLFGELPPKLMNLELLQETLKAGAIKNSNLSGMDILRRMLPKDDETAKRNAFNKLLCSIEGVDTNEKLSAWADDMAEKARGRRATQKNKSESLER